MKVGPGDTRRSSLGAAKRSRAVRDPLLRDLARAAKPQRLARRPKTAEQARAADWPEPHAVVHGLALYRCSPLRLLLTPAQCAFSRKAAKGDCEKSNPNGFPGKSQFEQSHKVQLYQDELEARAATCGKCPGVLALARGARPPKSPGEDELPRATLTSAAPLLRQIMDAGQ